MRDKSNDVSKGRCGHGVNHERDSIDATISIPVCYER